MLQNKENQKNVWKLNTNPRIFQNTFPIQINKQYKPLSVVVASPLCTKKIVSSLATEDEEGYIDEGVKLGFWVSWCRKMGWGMELIRGKAWKITIIGSNKNMGKLSCSITNKDNLSHGSSTNTNMANE